MVTGKERPRLLSSCRPVCLICAKGHSFTSVFAATLSPLTSQGSLSCEALWTSLLFMPPPNPVHGLVNAPFPNCPQLPHWNVLFAFCQDLSLTSLLNHSSFHSASSLICQSSRTLKHNLWSGPPGQSHLLTLSCQTYPLH